MYYSGGGTEGKLLGGCTCYNAGGGDYPWCRDSNDEVVSCTEASFKCLEGENIPKLYGAFLLPKAEP